MPVWTRAGRAPLHAGAFRFLSLAQFALQHLLSARTISMRRSTLILSMLGERHQLKRSPDPKHVLKLALYSDLLADAQAVAPELHVVLGDNRRVSLRLADYRSYARLCGCGCRAS